MKEYKGMESNRREKKGKISIGGQLFKILPVLMIEKKYKETSYLHIYLLILFVYSWVS